MEFRFLGTGTSVGIPMIGCHCPVCMSKDPHNRRRRSCLYVKTDQVAFVIDTPPDFREQMLDAGIEHLDAVVLTHAHADHIFGFDDIRRFNTMQHEVIPAYGYPPTIKRMQEIFDYIGQRPNPLGLYRPLIRFEPKDGPFQIGDVTLTPLPVEHGIPAVGYLLETADARAAYISDCVRIPEESMAYLHDLDVMALDGLRYRSHPTHFSVPEAVAVLQKIHAKRSYLVHLAHDLDHEKLSSELPPDIYVSYDGLQIQIPETKEHNK